MPVVVKSFVNPHHQPIVRKDFSGHVDETFIVNLGYFEYLAHLVKAFRLLGFKVLPAEANIDLCASCTLAMFVHVMLALVRQLILVHVAFTSNTLLHNWVLGHFR
jgi:hypothetical protein